jgi:hypothetical protein
MPDLLTKEPLLDRFAVSASRALANRLPRRTFLSRVGLYATAAVIGSSASTLLSQDPALANGGCGCNGFNSVSCQCLTGRNACPSGTCQCGCWTVCDFTICSAPNSVNWCDCCNTSAHSASCVSRCNSQPSNCFSKEHTGQGCTTGHTIRCRYHQCVGSPRCL